MYPNSPSLLQHFFPLLSPYKEGRTTCSSFCVAVASFRDFFPSLPFFLLTSSIPPPLSPPTAYLQMLLVPSSSSSSSFRGMHCERLFGWWGREAQGSRGGIGSVGKEGCCMPMLPEQGVAFDHSLKKYCITSVLILRVVCIVQLDA